MRSRRIYTVEQSADPYRRCPGLLDELDHLFGRPAGGDHVLDDQGFLMGAEFESSAEREVAFIPLRKHHSHAGRQRGCESQNDRTDRRTCHDVEFPFPPSSDLLAETLGQLRVFEDAELLDEMIRVASGGEAEVSLEYRPVASEDLEDLGLVQADTSSSIARAAAPGEDASVIGRPTTSTSAPASIACRGPRVRR